MHLRRILLTGGATAALLLISIGAALAAGPPVIVRVEGLNRTLVSATVVHTRAGWITKGGAPPGACSSSSAAGALDIATHHRWNGKYSTGLGIELLQVLRETHTFTSPWFWGIWVDHRFAQLGLCDLKLHPYEHLLFAPAPAKGTVYPTEVYAPASATAGHRFTVKVVYFNAKGKATALAGAHVDGAVSGRHGIVTLSRAHAGDLRLVATEKGYIRSVPVVVRIS